MRFFALPVLKESTKCWQCFNTTLTAVLRVPHALNEMKQTKTKKIYNNFLRHELFRVEVCLYVLFDFPFVKQPQKFALYFLFDFTFVLLPTKQFCHIYQRQSFKLLSKSKSIISIYPPLVRLLTGQKKRKVKIKCENRRMTLE